MIKTNIVKTTVETNEHSFYCDECGKCLGSSEEYDDGYYEDIGECQISFYIEQHGRYKFDKCLCDVCKEKTTNNIVNSLEKLGFKREE